MCARAHAHAPVVLLDLVEVHVERAHVAVVQPKRVTREHNSREVVVSEQRVGPARAGRGRRQPSSYTRPAVALSYHAPGWRLAGYRAPNGWRLRRGCMGGALCASGAPFTLDLMAAAPVPTLPPPCVFA